jgi:hypothetical protein
MVKQKAQHILEEKQNASIQKSMVRKQVEGNKLREKEAFDKQQKQIQKKLAKQKSQIKQKVNRSSNKLENQKKKQLAELKNQLTPEQFSKLQSFMQKNGNVSKEQTARQIQSEQAKKSWQEQVKKMKARQQEIQQKQQKQILVRKRLNSIKRKLPPKQQENLMKQLKLKEEQKMNNKARQTIRANNNKKPVKKQAPVRQAPVRQAPVKKAPVKQMKKANEKTSEVWTFVKNNNSAKVQKPVQQKASKGVQQFKTTPTKSLNASEAKIFNTEFMELCNVYECTTYATYSNYKTWSKSKSGKSVSNASVIAARNAPRMTKGLSKQMNFRKNSENKIQNAKPQQVRNNKNNRSRY